jgi:hypothetical protein
MLPDWRFDVRGSLRQFSIGLQRQTAIPDGLLPPKVRNPSGNAFNWNAILFHRIQPNKRAICTTVELKMLRTNCG